MLPVRYFSNNKSYPLCIPRGFFYFPEDCKHRYIFCTLFLFCRTDKLALHFFTAIEYLCKDD